MMTKLGEMPALTSVPASAVRKYLTREVPGKELEVDMSEEFDTPVVLRGPVSPINKDTVESEDTPATTRYDNKTIHIAPGNHGVTLYIGDMTVFDDRLVHYKFNNWKLGTYMRDVIMRDAWFEQPFSFSIHNGVYGPNCMICIPIENMDYFESMILQALGKYFNTWSLVMNFEANTEFNVLKKHLMKMKLLKGLLRLPQCKNDKINKCIHELIKNNVGYEYEFLRSAEYNSGIERTFVDSICSAELCWTMVRDMLKEDGHEVTLSKIYQIA